MNSVLLRLRFVRVGPEEDCLLLPLPLSSGIVVLLKVVASWLLSSLSEEEDKAEEAVLGSMGTVVVVASFSESSGYSPLCCCCCCCCCFWLCSSPRSCPFVRPLTFPFRIPLLLLPLLSLPSALAFPFPFPPLRPVPIDAIERPPTPGSFWPNISTSCHPAASRYQRLDPVVESPSGRAGGGWVEEDEEEELDARGVVVEKGGRARAAMV